MIKGYIRRLDFIAFVLVVPLIVFRAGAVQAAVLKSDVTVTGPAVTLGDVLDDAGAAAKIKIAVAPSPGERVALPVDAIARAATDNGIDYRNPYNLTSVSITRAGKEISRTAIAKSIAEAIKAKGDSGEKLVRLSAAQGTLYVPLTAAETVDVKDLVYDKATGMFTASVSVPSEAGRTTSITVTGRATDVVDIPVLSRSLSRGDVIAKDDIDWTRVAPSQAQGSVISDVKDLIGMSARRPLQANMPIRSGDVQAPILVAKNTLVTLVASTPNMVLTTVGRSLDEGGQGDVVRVMNTQTHKIVQGTVASANEIRIEISSRFASLSH